MLRFRAGAVDGMGKFSGDLWAVVARDADGAVISIMVYILSTGEAM